MTRPITPANYAMIQQLELMMALVRHVPLEWVVAWCNPRCEQRAATALGDRGVLTYLPMVAERRQTGRDKRLIETYRPMMVRYLFVGLDVAGGETVDLVRATDGVEGLLSVERGGRAVRVPVRDLTRVIATSIASFRGREIEVGHKFQLGDVVLVVDGPFAGQQVVVKGVAAGGEAVRADVSAFGGDVPATLPVDSLKASA
ncbi:transcription termination/antitermination protein NusG [Pannonibacter sp. SL95]|uniref:transcription termination/antitermination protein NusG n=1 Tax=Pannonibacter sp. SL95 TaxID=2995153 RepID=UPI0022740875|nr:transcription termination/antitermination NusG family protein [Pannonibacter sp. SL95]MCY1704498.1 hypothetical protein [Pannonibacter sp. SL95]